MQTARVLGHIPLGQLQPSEKVRRENERLHRTFKSHQRWMAALNRRVRVRAKPVENIEADE